MGESLIVSDESRANYLAKEFSKYGFEVDDLRWVNVTDRNGGDHNGFRLALLALPGKLPSLMARITSAYWRDMAERALATAHDYVAQGGDYTEVTMKADMSGAEAFVRGAKEGARAVGNALVDTVVGFVTLGSVDDLQVFGEAKGPGTGLAYCLARAGGEILLGVVTGGAANIGKAGKAVNVTMKVAAKLDKANDFVNTARDIGDKLEAVASGDPVQIAMALGELAVDKYGGKALDKVGVQNLKKKAGDMDVPNTKKVSAGKGGTPGAAMDANDVTPSKRASCDQVMPDGTPGCFVAGTQVVTIDGLKPIESLHAGDLVLSRDPQSGRQEYKRVLKAFSRKVGMLVHVRYRLNAGRRESRTRAAAASPQASDTGDAADDDGDADPDSGHLVTTDEHPFWLESKQAWCEAANLNSGDILRLANSSTAIVTERTIETPEPGHLFTVYNCTVEDYHTYFVAPIGSTTQDLDQAVFVHNNGTCKKAMEDADPSKPKNPGGEERGAWEHGDSPESGNTASRPRQRTSEENSAARNKFKNNKQEARTAWEERSGQDWPTDANGNPWPAEHTPSLKSGGDIMNVYPRDPGGIDPHTIPGSDGLTDYQRWGAMGTPAREENRRK